MKAEYIMDSETLCVCGHMRWEHAVDSSPRHCEHEHCRCRKFQSEEEVHS